MPDLSALAGFKGTTRSGLAIALRPMRAEDEPAFRDLYAEMRAPELQAAPWPAEAKRAFCDSQFSLQDQHYRAHYAQFLPLAICIGGEVVGRLYLGEFDGALSLMDIIVGAPQRRRGIASLLVGAVITHADWLQVETRLHVEPNNPVKNLYSRLGFRDIGYAGIYQQMFRPAGRPPAARSTQENR
jgi:ribosomal protein S18 acetylase RimI-like enzyme